MTRVGLYLVFIAVFHLQGCSNQTEPTVRIAINPWPGYEFLYLAQEKGFFKAQNLNIELIQMASLADVLRVYSHGRADGMASTMIEIVQAAGALQEPISLVLIPDYSNGGDTILAHTSIQHVSDLKGQNVGAELGSLGMYILSLALEKHGLSLGDVNILNIEQLDAETAMVKGEIKSIVTYPPFSTAILKQEGFHEIFNTAAIPRDVIDTVSIRTSKLNTLPKDWQDRFYQAWDMALDYAKTQPEDAYAIMAKREGITPEEFADALTGLKLLNSTDSRDTIASDQVKLNVLKVCNTLAHAKTINFECNDIQSLVITE